MVQKPAQSMMSEPETDFTGSKLALFIGAELLVYLRDDKAEIPWPACWDFPGGGREGDETPEVCVLRETCEEFGLRLHPSDLVWKFGHRSEITGGPAWFFAAHLPGDAVNQIRFGDEGQFWRLISPGSYASMPGAIPHLGALLRRYLDAA